MRIRPWPVSGVLFLLAACASTSPDRLVPETPSAVPASEERGLLLLMADRRLYEPLVVRQALLGGRVVRAELARALGRIGDDQGLDVLHELLEDPEPDVRREAAFALGRLEDPSSREPLLRAAGGRDEAVAQTAVESLARLGTPLEEVTRALAAFSGDDLWRRLAPALHLFDPGERLAIERLVLGQSRDARVRRFAAFSLTASPRAESRPLLRQLLVSEDPQIRAWAARALGVVGEAEDLARLEPLLADAATNPVLEALEAGRRLVASGAVAPSEGWRRALLERVDDARPAVRVQAVETSGEWLLDADLGAVLAARAAATELMSQREREAALLALARARDPRAEELLAVAATDRAPSVRAHAAAGAFTLGAARVLASLRDDPQPGVRAAVLGVDLLTSLRDPSGAGATTLDRRLLAALEDDSPLVRRTALAFLADQPLLSVSELASALATGTRQVPVRLLVTTAIVARVRRAEGAGEEHEAAVRTLNELARDPIHAVRLQAAAALASLGETAPSVGPVQTGRSAAVYEDVLARSQEPRDVAIRTARGEIVVRVDCAPVPFSCSSFLQLAAQGYYEGLTVSRRGVAETVGFGLDAEGGGPGYFVRDEPGPGSFDRGGLFGMRADWPETGASEVFFTLSPRPDLDGRATLLGTVESGLGVLETLLDGDLVLTLNEVVR